MAKKRRSRQYRDSSGVIDIDEARSKRREKRKKQQEKIKGEPKAEARSSRRSVRNSKIRRTAIYAVIILLIVTAISMSIYHIVSLKQEQKRLEAEQKQLKEQKKELKDELKHINDPDYIEEQARNQLRLVMPGETIYVFPNTDDTKKSSETTKANED